MKSENFSKNLQQIISTLGINQSELAEGTGLSKSAISQILNDKREPTLGTICKILEFLPVKFELLVK